MNKRILIASLQDNGELSEKNFKLEETPIPNESDLKDNQGNLRNRFFVIRYSLFANIISCNRALHERK